MNGICCYDLVSMDSKTLVLYLLIYFHFYLVYVFFSLQTKIKSLLGLGYDFISLEIICSSKTQFPMG
jgi:hypothetical protein